MKAKLKGFTLIELIVVMAIFSIVLAAATSLMQPVAKIMVYSDLTASGNAQVSNIATYLENSLGTAEYISKADFVPSDDDREDMVKYFVAENYSGILSKSTTMVDSDHNWVTLSGLRYGEGKVHVMTIDNANGGKISEYVYNVSFEPKADVDETSITLDQYNEFAVNKAYYDTFRYCVMPGVSDTSTTTFDFNTFLTLANNGKNSSFYIKAETDRNGSHYEYTTSATVMLVNTMQSHRVNNRPVGVYYIADKVTDANGKVFGETDYTETWGVIDQSEATINANVTIAASRSPVTIAGAGSNPSFGYQGNAFPYSSGGMCFIYSYGAEMSTD